MNPPLSLRAKSFWPWWRTLRDSGCTRRKLWRAFRRYWFASATPAAEFTDLGAIIEEVPGRMWRKEKP